MQLLTTIGRVLQNIININPEISIKELAFCNLHVRKAYGDMHAIKIYML